MAQAEVTWVPGSAPRWFTRPKMVTHPGSNWARCKITTRDRHVTTKANWQCSLAFIVQKHKMVFYLAGNCGNQSWRLEPLSRNLLEVLRIFEAEIAYQYVALDCSILQTRFGRQYLRYPLQDGNTPLSPFLAHALAGHLCLPRNNLAYPLWTNLACWCWRWQLLDQWKQWATT